MEELLEAHHYTPVAVAEALAVLADQEIHIQIQQGQELHQILITQDQQQHGQQEENQGDILYLHQQDQQAQLIREKVVKVQTVLFLKEDQELLEDQVMCP